jgi:hypothetical protein
MTTPTHFYGNSTNIPSELLKRLPENSQVLYWSLPDPNEPLCFGSCCESINSCIDNDDDDDDDDDGDGIIFLLPFLVICALPLSYSASVSKKAYLRQGVVVTPSTIEVIQMEYDVCCIPGMYTVAESSRSISLSSIKSVDIERKDCGCCLNCCFPKKLTKIRLNDGPINPSTKLPLGTFVYGHANADDLRQQVISAQDKLGPNASMMTQAVNIDMVTLVQQQGMMMQPDTIQSGTVVEYESNAEQKM